MRGVLREPSADQPAIARLHALLVRGARFELSRRAVPPGERLDEHVDAELAGRGVDLAAPGMRGHLDGCPACPEEHESLRALARED